MWNITTLGDRIESWSTGIAHASIGATKLTPGIRLSELRSYSATHGARVVGRTARVKCNALQLPPAGVSNLYAG